MQTLLFTKSLAGRTGNELAALGQDLGVDGFELCVRDGHPVTPATVTTTLPPLVETLRRHHLQVPLLSLPTSLTDPDTPEAEAILATMATCAIPFAKLGYFHFRGGNENYAAALSRAQSQLAGWQIRAERHGVTVLYHQHSGDCLGASACGLAQLLADSDPHFVGATLDPAHLLIDGEAFAYALAVVRPWLQAVSLKDVLLQRRDANGHGAVEVEWVTAGRGMVDWTAVWAGLDAAGFAGLCSVHAEFEVEPAEYDAALAREVAFFTRPA